MRNYAQTGRLDRATPVETAALENGQDDEEDMYAYSSFYPVC